MDAVRRAAAGYSNDLGRARERLEAAHEMLSMAERMMVAGDTEQAKYLLRSARDMFRLAGATVVFTADALAEAGR